MNARRILAAAGFAIVTAATAACSGGAGPTLSDNAFNDGPEVLPFAPPTDTSVFVPEDTNMNP
jgi:hypothetical protein